MPTRRGRPERGRIIFGTTAFIASGAISLAQLPTARLDGVWPRGGQAGSEGEISLHGADLDEARSLIFSHPGIHAVPSEAGKFKVSIASEVPPGLHGVRVSGRYGISPTAAFVVGRLPEVMEAPGNHTPGAAMAVALPATINGTADPEATDHFKVSLTQGTPVHIDCAAQRIDSPLTAVISIRDPDGREVHRSQRTIDRDSRSRFVPAVDGDHTVKVHDATWRGGPGFVYRLSLSTEPGVDELPAPTPLAGTLVPPLEVGSMAEREPNDAYGEAQEIKVPGEVTGHFDRDWYAFSATEAGALVVEVVSHRAGVAADPVVVVHKLGRAPDGTDQLVPVAEFDDTPGPLGAERFRLGSRDPVGQWSTEAGASYCIFVTDRFGSGGPYRLRLRPPQPGFEVFAMPESPVNDAIATMRWPVFLRRGGTAALAVTAVRLDGFDGPVEVTADCLPPGVTLSGGVLPPGASSGWIILHATDDAGSWQGKLALTARGDGLERNVREVIPRWNVANAGADRLDLRPAADALMLVVTEDADVPLKVNLTGPAPVETSLGATLEVPVAFLRGTSHKGFKGEWEAGLVGLPGQRAWHPTKPAADAAEATLSLPLTKKAGNQFVAGTWPLFAVARGTVQWQPGEAPVRDVRDAAYSLPLTVTIAPSPVEFTTTDILEVAQGGTAAVVVTCQRRFGFAEEIELRVLPADGQGGLSAVPVTVAKEATAGTLSAVCAADAPLGRRRCTIEAHCRWNEEELVTRREIFIEVTP